MAWVGWEEQDGDQLHGFQSQEVESWGHESHGTWYQECVSEDHQQFTRPRIEPESGEYCRISSYWFYLQFSLFLRL
jgi:hypothetical protein